MILTKGNLKAEIVGNRLIYDCVKYIGDTEKCRSSHYTKNQALVEGLNWLGLKVKQDNFELRFEDNVKDK